MEELTLYRRVEPGTDQVVQEDANCLKRHLGSIALPGGGITIVVDASRKGVVLLKTSGHPILIKWLRLYAAESGWLQVDIPITMTTAFGEPNTISLKDIVHVTTMTRKLKSIQPNKSSRSDQMDAYCREIIEKIDSVNNKKKEDTANDTALHNKVTYTCNASKAKNDKDIALYNECQQLHYNYTVTTRKRWIEYLTAYRRIRVDFNRINKFYNKESIYGVPREWIAAVDNKLNGNGGLKGTIINEINARSYLILPYLKQKMSELTEISYAEYDRDILYSVDLANELYELIKLGKLQHINAPTKPESVPNPYRGILSEILGKAVIDLSSFAEQVVTSPSIENFQKLEKNIEVLPPSFFVAGLNTLGNAREEILEHYERIEVIWWSLIGRSQPMAGGRRKTISTNTKTITKTKYHHQRTHHRNRYRNRRRTQKNRTHK